LFSLHQIEGVEVALPGVPPGQVGGARPTTLGKNVPRRAMGVVQDRAENPESEGLEGEVRWSENLWGKITFHSTGPVRGAERRNSGEKERTK